MRYSKYNSFLVLLAMGVSPGLAAEEALACDIGPVNKVIGGSPWTIYSCSDNVSVVIVSKPESKAHPFYFMFSSADGGYRLSGEGQGSKSATKATYDELEKFTKDDIAALVLETQQSAKKE